MSIQLPIHTASLFDDRTRNKLSRVLINEGKVNLLSLSERYDVSFAGDISTGGSPAAHWMDRQGRMNRAPLFRAQDFILDRAASSHIVAFGSRQIQDALDPHLVSMTKALEGHYPGFEIFLFPYGAIIFSSSMSHHLSHAWADGEDTDITSEVLSRYMRVFFHEELSSHQKIESLPGMSFFASHLLTQESSKISFFSSSSGVDKMKTLSVELTLPA